jgi:hypothetical protein
MWMGGPGDTPLLRERVTVSAGSSELAQNLTTGLIAAGPIQRFMLA